MINKEFELFAGPHRARLVTYLLSDAHRAAGAPPRRTVLVIPGGGYLENVEREAEPIAVAFNARGFNCCVLYYSVTPVPFPVSLEQAARAIALIRDHAAEWNLLPDKIFVAGFSAGGHLAASAGTLWDRDFLAERVGRPAADFRPDGMVLSYPVITSGEYAHHPSIQNLLVDKYGDAELMETVSLEKQVRPSTVPAFIWTTVTDEVVPMENTLFFINALRKNGVNFEAHIFPYGIHGAALASEETYMADRDAILPEAQCWPDMAARFLNTL